MTTAGGDGQVDALRRRLYRPGATDEDLRAYEAARPLETAEEAEEPALSPRGRHRRLVVVAAVAGVLAVLVAGVLLRPAAEPARPVAARPSPVLLDIGDGASLDVAAGSASRATAVVTAVDGTPVIGRRVEGRGNAVVDLDPDRSAAGGRAVIAVASAGTARVTWRVLLDVLHPDWSASVFVLAQGRAEGEGDAVPATTFTFAARPPTRIAVQAPDGVRWAVVYAATVGTEPVLH